MIGILAVLVGCFYYFELQVLGFPDGHMGRLDWIRKFTYIGFLIANGSIALYAAIAIFKKAGALTAKDSVVLTITFIGVNLFQFGIDQICYAMFYDGAGG